MDEWDVLSFGLSIAGRDPSHKWNTAAKLLSFRSLYGIEPDTAIDILNDIQNMNNKHRIQHPKVVMFLLHCIGSESMMLVVTFFSHLVLGQK